MGNDLGGCRFAVTKITTIITSCETMKADSITYFHKICCLGWRHARVCLGSIPKRDPLFVCSLFFSFCLLFVFCCVFRVIEASKCSPFTDRTSRPSSLFFFPLLHLFFCLSCCLSCFRLFFSSFSLIYRGTYAKIFDYFCDSTI